jgi:glycosyltransferase involved in cell wall biosynthesis
LHVLVATLGRAELTRQTIDRLADQTRPPDGVVVVGVGDADIDGVDRARGTLEIVLGPRGSCAQRNHGLDMLQGRSDIVVFFDDDFVPSPDYLEQIERMFDERSELAGLTGKLIADGINGGGFSLDQAVALIEGDVLPAPPVSEPIGALYGCNMALRMAMVGDVRFDENLPLYGWQEDIDFSRSVARRGALLSTSRLRGVHMGARGGRTSGVRFGYSQIANPFYLVRKGTMPRGMALGLAFRNFAANIRGSVNPEPHIDRRGRLRGNLLALGDIVRGRSNPRRILELG